MKKPAEVFCVIAMICATAGVLNQTMRNVIHHFRVDWARAIVIEATAREPESYIMDASDKRWKVIVDFTAETEDGIRFNASRSVANERYADQAKAVARRVVTDRPPIWYDRNEPSEITFDPNGDSLKYGAIAFFAGIFILGEFAVLIYVIFRRHNE